MYEKIKTRSNKDIEMTKTTTYHRYTSNPDKPMSDWYHAMFSDSVEKINYNSYYGCNAWVFVPNEKTAHVDDLMEQIKQAWEKELALYEERGFYSHSDGNDIEYWLQEGYDADTIAASFNPEKIVNSADAWDSELMIWFYNRIAKPNGLDAVITDDGAVVWNENLIKRDPANDW